MNCDPAFSIVITDGYWMHIRHTRIYHRDYPEVQGEGRSFADAATHLANQLNQAVDFVHGRSRRERLARAIADIRALRAARPMRRAANRNAAEAAEASARR